MVHSLAQGGLRGPVKSCTQESTLPAAEGLRPEIRSKSTMLYDAQGRPVESRILNSDGSQYVSRYDYAPSGQLLKITSGNQASTPKETTYSYDEQGRIRRITNLGWNEKPLLFHYDEQGHKTSTQTLTPQDYRPNMAVGGSPFEALGMVPNLPGGGSMTTIYDDHDRPTEIQVRDAKDQLISHAVRTYDAQGHVTDEKQVQDKIVPMFDPETQQKILEESGLSPEQLDQELQAGFRKLMGGQNTPYSVSFRYDGEGRQTHTTRRIINHEDEIETTYNAHGDIESEITRSSESDAEDASTPRLGHSYSEVRYAYQYDQQGNWIEKTTSYRSAPDGEFQSPTISKRTLTYW